MRDAKRRVKELAEALKREPGSIPKRLELAAALREAGRPADAIDLYRGVAEAYAEEGRLVQAMAVCKGILEIDPEHRDTIEMLATLANRRASRRGEAELRREGGRWVAEPSDATGSDEEETSASDKPLGLGEPGPVFGSALYDDESVDEVPGEPTEDREPTPPHFAAGDESSVEHALEDHGLGDVDESLATSHLPDTDQTPPPVEPTEVLAPPRKRTRTLDFPPETKELARGDRLLAFAEPSPSAAPSLGARPPRDTEPMAAALPDEPDATRAGTPRALESGRPPAAPVEHVEHELSWDEDDDNRVLADALHAPFPKAELEHEPPPFPLLSDLPRAAFMELLARLTVLRLQPGETILREGEAGDACYLVASGTVRVTKHGIEVARLGPGAFFGEFAVLADQRRHASVETVDDVELLEIRRGLLDELVAAHPGVARTLRTFYRERLMSTLLATAPFFSQLSPEERATIAERFRQRRFGRGAHILDEGSAGGGLYLILVGEVAVVRGVGADEVVLGKLGEGSYFGEMSLLKGGVASATVRATRMTEVVQLPPRDFYEVVSQHPVLWEQLRSEAERREMANHALLTGEARTSGDGSVYLL